MNQAPGLMLLIAALAFSVRPVLSQNAISKPSFDVISINQPRPEMARVAAAPEATGSL